MSLKAILATCMAIWLLVSAMLYFIGYNHFMIAYAILHQAHEALVDKTQVIENPQITVAIVLLAALVVGYVKGRLVIAKVAGRNIARLHQLDKIKWYQLYPASFYLLIAVMIALSAVLTRLDVDHLIRGFIDVAVATALGYGSLCYWKGMQHTHSH